MQRIKILGITLTDHSYRESINLAESFLNNGALNTILYISTKMLVDAGKDANQKEWIEGMDLTVWSDADILHVAGITSRNRFHEVETMELFRELIRRVARTKKKVFLLTDSEEKARNLKSNLLRMRPDLEIVGHAVLQSEDNKIDHLINQINDVVPTVIFSQMEPARQEQLMTESKKLINAEVWMALTEHFFPEEKQNGVFKKSMNKLYHRYFYKKVSQYNEQEEIQQMQTS